MGDGIAGHWQADFLSLKAWILSKNVKEKCTEDLLPILYVYSLSPECEEQDKVLQEIKKKYPY